MDILLQDSVVNTCCKFYNDCAPPEAAQPNQSPLEQGEVGAQREMKAGSDSLHRD